MFIGHFAVGFGAKALAPRTSLGTLFLAALFIDLLWPTLLLLGLERVSIEPGITAVVPLRFDHYPYSHSLLAVLLWAPALALFYHWRRRYRRGALVLGAALLSHWLLDALVHRPDLPLAPGSETLIGLGIWSSVAATLALELSLLAIGLWLYLRTTRGVGGAARWGVWGFAAFIVLIYLGNIYGEPPPSVTLIAWVGQAQWLLVAWGYWLERRRPPA